MNLLRTKSISRIQADAAAGLSDHSSDSASGGMRKTLGQLDLTLMGIAAIIGAGVFAMIGKASYNGGPAVVFLFVFTALACAFSALCYAEFASRIPVAGSAYTYSYASLGELVAWIIGWDLIVEYAIGNIAVAISWSDYFTGMLKGYNIHVPEYFTMDFLTARRGFEAVSAKLAEGVSWEYLSRIDVCRAEEAVISCAQIDAYNAWLHAPRFGDLLVIADLPALLITLSITTLVFIGIRESKVAGNVMTVLKVAIILLVIVLGAFYVDPGNWSPFAPNGISGVMMGVSAVFFAYIGFDALSTTAEECKNPRRDLPRAMIWSLTICTVLYILLALVLTGMVPYTKLNVGDPLAFVFGAEGANIQWVAGIIAVSAVIALATVFLVFQIGQPRLWMAMSRDGLLPKRFSVIHPRFKTPWFATIITGLVVAIPALFMNLTEVTDLASIGTLFAFSVVCAGVLFKDKEFRESGPRFVPYLNSRYSLPLIALFVLFSLVVAGGVSSLNSSLKRQDVVVSLTEFKEVTEEDRFGLVSLETLSNSQVYSEGFASLKDVFSVQTQSVKTHIGFKVNGNPRSGISVDSEVPVFIKIGDREEHISFEPDKVAATSEEEYWLAFTPYITKTIVTTPNANPPQAFMTDKGQIEVTISRELQNETWLSALSHKIPTIVFLAVAAVLLVLSVLKGLSLIPILGLLSCLYLMTELGVTNWMRFGAWLLAGLVIYFAYGIKHSNLNKPEPVATE